ncbi:uncharacterized protein LOC128863343 [Anastrepha ludens]|uniref:uncharacterized protein LOC128863343 n=1 Tax=Anastrepha ludens TaxID=28586 RepID=UPI0023AEB1B9|nr:uncharacterized protein LOC128863343 [Anastrepha ludens]XP_053958438.1 uncharacterized protein LOC128863343 [Anastrepha ludens]XP_053958439.1 uncharacterized protein LOC128863343 [Anastrepha ludens]XP_053958440.1 uncharacterized protein LOC128863343 [Anastrepha ludens]XP_053958441.1 uncharacterized protein LOC128863343 [Anastrepha ludens]XP_053958442.1 uncharacterized protein LOC128863343 [Anastrepha ludens]XP_053958443.1 uncharacterized protein LOC128863343 [Anastrepha ludens]XP_05395844
MTSTTSPIQRLAAAAMFLLLFSHVNGNGYHYDPPALTSAPSPSAPSSNSGHYFAPIPTIAPLPPVPALPALPTGRPQVQTLFPTGQPARPPVQTIVQVHTATQHPPKPAPPQPRPPTFRPGPFNTFAGNYREPSFELRPGFVNRNAAPGPQQQQAPPLVGFHYPATAVSAPSAPGRFVPASLQQAAPQPLRVPFGKQPVLNYATGPDSDFYVVNGRQLKQYAVVEFVDNDISQDTKPFLSQSFVNNYRAQVGASGTGAIAPLPSAMQLDTTANAILREQLRLAQQGGRPRGDTIALGSGGIGFVRLPDGTVSLGSGSLNFVTTQQHLADLRNARTRSESQRDPLHFGHGPLEDPNNRILFK